MLVTIAIEHSDQREIKEYEVGKRVYRLGDVCRQPVVFLAPDGERSASFDFFSK